MVPLSFGFVQHLEGGDGRPPAAADRPNNSVRR